MSESRGVNWGRRGGSFCVKVENVIGSVFWGPIKPITPLVFFKKLLIKPNNFSLGSTFLGQLLGYLLGLKLIKCKVYLPIGRKKKKTIFKDSLDPNYNKRKKSNATNTIFFTIILSW